MGFFNRFTRKQKKNNNKNNQKNFYPNVSPGPKPRFIFSKTNKYVPRSQKRQQFFKKFADEIVSIWAPKANNPPNSYKERNYETEASSYLRKLYVELNEKNDKNFINKKLREFQRTAPSLSMSPEAKQIVESKLKQLRIYNQLLQNNNNNSTRRRSSTRTSFSSHKNTFSNSNSNSNSGSNSNSSLPSLQSLRNNTKNFEESTVKPMRTPRRRLQGKVINPKIQSLKEE